MAFPEPVPGLVIRYSYLWHSERLRNLEEGAKDRPCMIVLAVQREGEATIVTVVPITRRAPPSRDLAVKLSVEAKRRLGLDDSGPSWIITNDVNQFAWPGPDIRRVATSPATKFAYGLVPRSMFYDVRDAVVKHHEAGTLHIGRRK